jgi:mono/diheme cytochrome c family protein
VKLIGGILIGAGLTLVAIAATGYALVYNGWVPAGMDQPPSAFEKWAARTSLHATMKREATATSPLPASEENLMAGAKVYQASCLVCHGAPQNKETDFSKALSPKPPQFADGEDVTDDPEGSTYWKVNHGIKFTAMPSFKQILSNDQMWQVALFLKHQDKLPANVDKLWQAMK